MKKNDPIANIMSDNVECVQEGLPLSNVRHLMCNQAIHHVPIVRGKKLTGLVSFTDMMKLNFVLNGATDYTVDAIIDQQFSITDVMSRNITTINHNDNIRSAAEILAEGKFHSLPVIDDESNLLGIVTSTDLIRYLNAQY